MTESVMEQSRAEMVIAENSLLPPAATERRSICDSGSPALSVPAANARPGYSGIEEHSAPLHSFMEHAMTILFPVMLAAVLYFSLARLFEINLLWTLLIALPVAWAVGDLVSGISHWVADTYGSEELPIVGAAILRPFRLHHKYPRDICTHNLFVTIGNTCIVAMPLMLLFLYLLWGENVSGLRAFAIFTAASIVGVTVLTNIFHKWAHAEEPSRLACALQKSRLVLTPQHHQNHHTQPFNTNYCITNGWLNPVLERIRFFRGLEYTLGKFGIKPHCDH